MEIKTCEDYVVTRLMQLEDECVDLQDNIRNLNHESDVLTEMLDDIKRILKPLIVHASDGELYINTDSVWKKYDKNDYDRLCKIFYLTYEEEEDEEE